MGLFSVSVFPSFFFPVSLMFTFSPNQNLIASLPITVSTPSPPPTAAAIFVACWMAWETGRERFWRLAASRLVAHLVWLFLSFKQYKGRKRLLVLRLSIKVAVVRRTLLLVGRGLIPHFLSFSQKTSVIAILPIIPYPSLILANPASRVAVKSLAREQVLWGALTAGRDKKGELATTSLEFEFRLQFPCGSPSTELSDFRQSTRSGNKCECKQTLKTRSQGKDVITNVISANLHFASTFFMQIFKFQRRAARALRTGELARRLSNPVSQ